MCGKKITIGVSHRIEELSDREEGYRPENAKPFESLVPLPEVIGPLWDVLPQCESAETVLEDAGEAGTGI